MGKLTQRQVQTKKSGSGKKGKGLWSDGGNLYLQVNSLTSKSWIFRYYKDGKSKEMGLGSALAVPLIKAREEAGKLREALALGRDPYEEREKERIAAKVEAAKRVTFREAAKRYINAQTPSWSPRHKQAWESSLRDYVYDEIGDIPVEQITVEMVMKVLTAGDFWYNNPPTAANVRCRIEKIIGTQEPETRNPAEWARLAARGLPSPRKVRKPEHHPALPVAKIPEFMAMLRRYDDVRARCLEFTILAACRSDESIGARWSEINLATGVWVIPAGKMKSDEEHHVPLVGRALEIVRELRKTRRNEFVFPADSKDREGKTLIDDGLRRYLHRHLNRDGNWRDDKGELISVHGFRSAFKDWCRKRGYQDYLSEFALAHVVGNSTVRAYGRDKLCAERAVMMKAWSDYCSPTDSNVIHLNRAV